MYDPSGFTAARQSLIVPPEGSPSNHIVDQSVALALSASRRSEPIRSGSGRPVRAYR